MSTRAASLPVSQPAPQAGRPLVLIVLFAYFMLLLALGGHMAWKHLGVPATPPSFSDLRSVTSGWECTRRHIDVLPKNPCDPWGPRPRTTRGCGCGPHTWGSARA